MNLGVNLPTPTYTEAGSTALPPPLSVGIFRQLGTSESLEITFVPVVPGFRVVERTVDADPRQRGGFNLIGEYNLTFDDSRGAGGTLASVTVVSGGPTTRPTERLR